MPSATELVTMLQQLMEPEWEKIETRLGMRIDRLHEQVVSYHQRVEGLEKRLFANKQLIHCRAQHKRPPTTTAPSTNHRHATKKKKRNTSDDITIVSSAETIGSVRITNAKPLTNRVSAHFNIFMMSSKTPVNTVWNELFNGSQPLRFKSPQHVSAQIAILGKKHVECIHTQFGSIVQRHFDYFGHHSHSALFAKWDVSNVFVIKYEEGCSWGKWHYDLDAK